MKALRTVAAAALAAGLLVACSDDDKGSSSASGGDFCDQVRAFKTENDAINLIFDAEAPDPEALKAAFGRFLPLIESLRANAPAEIKADMEIVTGVQSQLVSVFEQYDYNLAAVATSPEFTNLQTNNAAEVEAAGDRLDEWSQTECGVTIGD
ncbi:MAG TPA: hypothetical protein DCR14_20630 [Acidimicrobiaceae bacterium]|nr:hypothetical protein [Acidimicrobiaceae bacterium]